MTNRLCNTSLFHTSYESTNVTAFRLFTTDNLKKSEIRAVLKMLGLNTDFIFNYTHLFSFIMNLVFYEGPKLGLYKTLKVTNCQFQFEWALSRCFSTVFILPLFSGQTGENQLIFGETVNFSKLGRYFVNILFIKITQRKI